MQKITEFPKAISKAVSQQRDCIISTNPYSNLDLKANLTIFNGRLYTYCCSLQYPTFQNIEISATKETFLWWRLNLDTSTVSDRIPVIRTEFVQQSHSDLLFLTAVVFYGLIKLIRMQKLISSWIYHWSVKCGNKLYSKPLGFALYR